MKKILVIDDSEVNLFLLQTILGEMDEFQIQIESDSSEAFSYLREGKPDLLFLDLMMPVHGFDIIEQVKNDQSLCKIPIIVVTAMHDDDTKEKVIALRVDELIHKPIFAQDVQTLVRKYLAD